jgi:hypothetical protein
MECLAPFYFAALTTTEVEGARLSAFQILPAANGRAESK